MTDDTNISEAIAMMLEAGRDHHVRWSLRIEDTGNEWGAELTLGASTKKFTSDYFGDLTSEILGWVETECDARDQAKYDAAGLNEEPA